MIQIIGSSALTIAFAISLLGLGVLLAGILRDRRVLVEGGYAAIYTTFGLLAVATLAMVVALVTHDFSVSYVSQVGSRATPTFYTIISLWGALEGSILFWGFVLALYSAVAIYRNRAKDGKLVPYAGVALLGIQAFFFLLLVGPADPFGLVNPAPPDGPGPNPLLQNHPLMAVHPPLLYLGYVGMSVPFAFAFGALASGDTSSNWIKDIRRWMIVAWAFLSAAIVAGMWWSYEVLGWGGYWAWDPVENASFLPWLTATAFLHSMMVEERRGMLRVWNVSLVVATFLLTILGTFLTRSGVLSSVHAFAEGEIGYYFLSFIAFVLVVSLVLLTGRSGSLTSTGRLDAMASRETVFLMNNLLFTAFTFTVLLGTLYPLVAEAIRGEKVSVGAPFFNRMTLPICMLLLFLMGVGPALPWKRASREQLKKDFLIPLIAMVVVAIVSVALGARDVFAIVTFAFATFALIVNGREFVRGAAARMRAHGETPWLAFGRLVGANRRRYGGYTAHIGAIVLAVAVAASSAFRMEKEATLKPGETMSVGGYTVRLDGMWAREEPQRFVVGADVAVIDGGTAKATMNPRLNFYRMSDQPISTPSVRSRASGDLYLNLMAFQPDGSSGTLRVIVEPLVPWIWFGGLVIVFGSVIAVWPGVRTQRRGAAIPSPRPAVGGMPEPVPGQARVIEEGVGA